MMNYCRSRCCGNRILRAVLLSIAWVTSALTMSSSAATPSPSGLWSPADSKRFYTLPKSKVDNRAYSLAGDINIGAIFMITSASDDLVCSEVTKHSIFGLIIAESIAFVVDQINKDPDLLPNVTLGFVVLNDCSKRAISLAQSLAFISRSHPCAGDQHEIETSPNTSLSSSEFCSADNAFSNLSDPIPHYDVIGVLSPLVSTFAIPVSYLYAVAQIPNVGCTTTSDDLSDKLQHPYFLRVVPPDRHLVDAIIKFIGDNGWTYISVVYTKGEYGERAFDNIVRLTPAYGICIASSHKTHANIDMSEVAHQLIMNGRARVVVLIAYGGDIRRLFSAVERLNASSHFIWIGSDGLADISQRDFSQHMNNFAGAFRFLYYSVDVSDFQDYFRALRVHNSTNPWLRPIWEAVAGCSFSEGSCDSREDITSQNQFVWLGVSSLLMDAVLTLAHGAHGVIRERCPEATGKQARECIRGDVLLQYMRNISFRGYTGDIRFDENGDISGKYTIHQIDLNLDRNSSSQEEEPASESSFEYKLIGIYDISSNSIRYTADNISWDHLDVKDRIVPLTRHDTKPDVPESVCSRPCVPGEYKIQKKLPCCWECRRCRNNERLALGKGTCVECQPFTWPDPSTGFTTCISIPLTFQSLSNTLPVIQIFLGLLGIVTTILVTAAYAYFRESRVIKAASRELSFLQLVAIFLGYVTIVFMQIIPTHTTCSAIYFLFCLSFTWLYSPLLVKTIRIFRIFRSGSKSTERPNFVSPQSQIIMAVILICIQLILCGAIQSLYRPSAKRYQPVATENLVELTCDFTFPGLASFLVYNLVMLVFCSVFAFKTRKLPENFNESRFISMCVSTTLMVWLAFIPTYFTASRAMVRAIVLSMALLLNHTVALIFLFLPKIYAAALLPPENTLATAHGQSTLVSRFTSVGRHRVEPMAGVSGVSTTGV